MLELRPTCEHCNKDLPADAVDAFICSFECTFCQSCSQGCLAKICPNCSGELVRRPVRPASALAKFPASSNIVYKPVDMNQHKKLISRLESIGKSQHDE